MNGTIYTYTFTADNIQPSLTKPQLNDSATTLTITGYEKSTGNKMIIAIRKFTGKAGTFSIAQGEAGGQYQHSGILSTATSGIVAIKEIGASTITGYYQFATSDGINVVNGNYIVAKPWDY
jgi:hypothetical protein